MSNDQEKGSLAPSGIQPVGELLAAALTQILSVLIPPVGATGAVALSVWQQKQQQKFAAKVERQLKILYLEKVDHSALLDSIESAMQSDRFQELLSKVLEEASRTGTDKKREALAKALVNSLFAPESSLSNKLTLFRLLASMSDEELTVFEAIANVWAKPQVRCRESDIASELNWERIDVQAACEGLVQLRLIEATEKNDWRIALLGSRLIELLTGTELSETVRTQIGSDAAKQAEKAVEENLIKAFNKASGVRSYRNTALY